MRETRVEVGSNTSTVILRVVGGDENGSLKSETVKYGRELRGNRFMESLPSKERRLWLHYSGFQTSCYNIYNTHHI
jgi:hypothetical protein